MNTVKQALIRASLKRVRIHLDFARAMAKIARFVSETDPEFAMVLDSNYRDALAEARVEINHAIKIRREENYYGY